ncbi:PIN/TRAM domain-containing protein [Veillonella denticariosi JCM 15641]|uniref:PIN/TRAM domain-containing protein n=1 Tax=Veillonella denticariosi JCM 15641 TaxID=1298594 RepID=A0A2S7Z7M3_9FIRM|nr:PIN/TRAM domain-containing protein [Veillonella denticariosi]PQL19195.1 PIN/TRAM domain-containing protein [Veillonella denticariosi JCM 15641]
MIYRILRYVIAILVGTAAYVGMDTLAPIIDPYLVSQFETFGDMSLTVARLGVLIFGTVLGVIIGYLVSSFILKQGLVVSKRLERVLSHIPNQELIAGTIGLLFGLIIANLIGVAFNQVPIIGPYIPIILSAIFGYSGLKIMARKGPEIYLNYVQQWREDGTKKPGRFKMFSNHKNDKSESTPKLLDTSVIIDGRIKELCGTGFIEGPLVVPLFVLNELQIISDSADATKRNRGRRGLDILKEMQDANNVAIEVVEDDYDDLTEVDSKLMRLALDKQWKLMTNDFNLNKVARVQGITVLNLNELANVLKPALIAGEWIRVQIMKEGKEIHQGVAYLDDGTMIVVEDGRPYVGQSVEVMVTSILQTSAGRMIFARVDGGQHGQGD